MIKKILALAFCLLTCTLGAEPVKVKIGTYIQDVYGIDWHKETCELTFWLWMNHDQPIPDLGKKIVLINAIEQKTPIVNTKRGRDGTYWTSVQYRAKLLQKWQFKDFPFGYENIEIIVEPFEYNANELVFVVDEKQSTVDDAIDLFGWTIRDLKMKAITRTYNTTFGDPDYVQGSSSFSRVLINLHFVRASVRMFFQLYGVFYLAYFLALIALLIPYSEMNSKVGLVLGAIFAAIGNNFSLEVNLPPVGEMTFADYLQLLVFALIAYAVLTIVITRHLIKAQKTKAATIFEWSSFAFSLLLFISLNSYWIHKAITS